MKYEDLDDYIEQLFNQPLLPGDNLPGNDLSGFENRLINVEQAILDAYESAMRWHSAQIVSGSNISDNTSSTSTPSEYEEHWSEAISQPDTPPIKVVINDRPVKLHVTYRQVAVAQFWQEFGHVTVSTGKALIKLMLRLVLLLILLCIVIIAFTDALSSVESIINSAGCPPGTIPDRSMTGIANNDGCSPVGTANTEEESPPTENKEKDEWCQDLIVFPGASPDGQMHCYKHMKDGTRMEVTCCDP